MKLEENSLRTLIPPFFLLDLAVGSSCFDCFCGFLYFYIVAVISLSSLVTFSVISRHGFPTLVLCIISGCFMPSIVVFSNYIIMHCYSCTRSRLYFILISCRFYVSWILLWWFWEVVNNLECQFLIIVEFLSAT